MTRNPVLLVQSNFAPKAVCDFPLYVIYDNPTDYPNQIVVRKWILSNPTDEVKLYNSLAEARHEFIQQGLLCITRHRSDDRCIVETWL